MRKTRKETPIVVDFDSIMTGPEFITADRGYGRTEKLVLCCERDTRNMTPGQPILVEELIHECMRHLAEPLEGHRDRREYRVRQALKTITHRECADLAVVNDEVVRTAAYMVPYVEEDMPEEARGLTQRRGRLGERIKTADVILAEEFARLDAGLAVPERDPLRIHLAMAIIGPKLLTTLLAKVDEALAERERVLTDAEEFI